MKNASGISSFLRTLSLLTGLTLLVFLAGCRTEIPGKRGLIGLYCSEPDLTSIKGISILDSLNQRWDNRVDYEGGTSGDWKGYLIAPVSGRVNLYFSTNRTLTFILGEKDSITVHAVDTNAYLTVKMHKGKNYPVHLIFLNPGDHAEIGWFDITWGWQGQEKTNIPPSALFYTEKEDRGLDFLRNRESIPDSTKVIFAPGKNVIVFYRPGRFGGWPANTGIWHWGDEILVGFTLAWNKENKYHHAINNHRPSATAFARSTNGGETWVLADTSSLSKLKKIQILKNKINYMAPGFALLNKGERFFYSYDKGHRWQGPFLYPDLGTGVFTSRTDYLVESADTCLIFMSAKDTLVRAALQDHAFCVKTTDGGKHFTFLSWMTERDSVRSVMPSTVRVGKNHLISAMRRRLDPPKNDRRAFPVNWIDMYESTDNGHSWHFLHKIANTDDGLRNGNPPALVRLKSGLLCVTYGFRGRPYGIRAKISSDHGKTWSKEIILRDDARTWDIGYVRSVVRDDDKVVTVYYYSTESHPERHIEATIWDPQKFVKNIKP